MLLPNEELNDLYKSPSRVRTVMDKMCWVCG
jgi:hypothetical protein